MTDKPIGPQVRIRDLRNAYGISVKELVERIESVGLAGVHEDTIRNVELGHKRASVPLMNAWARALGLNPLDVWQPPASPTTRQRDARQSRQEHPGAAPTPTTQEEVGHVPA